MSVCWSQLMAKLIEMPFGCGFVRPKEPSRYYIGPGSLVRRGTFEIVILGLRLAWSRYSQPYSQCGSKDVASGYDFRSISFILLFYLNYLSCFSGLQLGIDIPSTSKCLQLKQTVFQISRPIYHGGCRRLGDQNKHTCQEGTEITELFEA